MKKLLFLFAFIFSFGFITAQQNPVLEKQPYYFQKTIEVKEGIKSSIYLQGQDTMATKKQFRDADATIKTHISNIDNTSDLNKPISTATQSALNSKQNTLVNPVIQADSIIKYVTPYQLIQSLPTGFELEVVTGGLTQISVPFTLTNRTLVWYNGSILSKTLWTGVGTQSITLFVDTKQKDRLIIQNQ